MRYLRYEDVKTYLAISGPSVVMLFGEWGAYDLLTVMSSMISVSALSAMSISANFFNLLLQFPYGFQMGIVAVVGNIVGEENERIGKFMGKIAFVQATLITCSIAWLTRAFRQEIATSFTSDEETVADLQDCLESLALATAILGSMQSLQGQLKALK